MSGPDIRAGIGSSQHVEDSGFVRGVGPSRHGGDFACADADGANGVEARLGVDDAAVPDHDVVGAGLGVGGGCAEQGSDDTGDE